MGLGDKLPVVMEPEFKAEMARKMDKPQELPDGISLNDVRTPGEYYKRFGGETIRDMPYTAGSFSLKVELNGSDGGGVKHTWSSYDGNDTWTRTTNVKTWRPWRRLANTDDLLNKANVTEETVTELSSPTQLVHGGRFNIQSISAEINAHASANASLTDYATGDFHALLLATHFDDQGCRFGTLLLTTPRSPGRTWVGQIWEHEFRNWIRLTTATPPQEHYLPLAEGVSAIQKNYYLKRQDSCVEVHFSVAFPPISGRIVAIAALPAGYLPDNTEADSCTAIEGTGDVMGAAKVEVLSNGVVQIYVNAAGAIGAAGSIEFTATH